MVDNATKGDEHVVRSKAVAEGTFVIWGLGDSEFKQEGHEYGQFNCSCGATFDDRDDAEDHVIEANASSNSTTDT